MRNLSRTALFNELGKGYKPPSFVSYPINRDQIVLNEFLSKGPLGDVEVHQIIVGDAERDPRKWQVVNSRMHAFLRVAQARKEIAAYAPALERLCMTATEGGGLSEGSVPYLLGTMHRNGFDVSPVALSFVERNQFAKVGFHFLAQYSNSEETLQKLAALPAQPEYQKEKEHTLKRIRERMPRPAPK